MSDIRDERAASILLTQAATYIAAEAGRSTLITPTRAEFSKDRKNAYIYISVFPQEEAEHALAFLRRHKDLFRTYLKKHARFARLPYIFFDIDQGELHRQHIDEVSRGL